MRPTAVQQNGRLKSVFWPANQRMGLCRCPQRKVSTLFCFKHHVNVCESCLVSEHPQCIVRSYVSWLQDNDYNPNCSLCQCSLLETNDETVRLICHDLFHWSCLNEYCRSFPNHTAPDGYTCPTCHVCIFPPSNLVSPVAAQLRAKLAQVNWANRLPILSSSESFIHPDKQPLLTETENNGYVIVDPTPGGLSHHPHRMIDMPHAPLVLTRKVGCCLNVRASPTRISLPLQPFHIDLDDDDKYKRRSVFTWLARWLHSRQPSILTQTRTQRSRTRFTIYLALLIVVVFLTLIIVLYHYTRGESNEHLDLRDDPQFDPLNNPLIRVGARARRNPLREPDVA